jgi:signal transduction histidine kinase
MSDSFLNTPAAIEVALLKIVQEGLTNVQRHSQATQCSVVIKLVDQMLTLDLWDNGLGLPETHEPGIGLTVMRERASELGGTFMISSSGTTGTHINAQIPIPKEN